MVAPAQIVQFYGYRCYKGYPSIVLFTVIDARRRLLYCDYGIPGRMGDPNIFDISELKRQISSGRWLGDDVPSLNLSGTLVRPYLLGDCAFSLSVNMMKTTSKREQKVDFDLKEWEKVASRARKPVECAFGTLKYLESLKMLI